VRIFLELSTNCDRSGLQPSALEGLQPQGYALGWSSPRGWRFEDKSFAEYKVRLDLFAGILGFSGWAVDGEGRRSPNMGLFPEWDTLLIWLGW
jgi:hypothetical protein